MHALLHQYQAAVAALDVPGDAQLETLRARDQLAQLEAGLTADERMALHDADVALARGARRVVKRLEELAPMDALRPAGVTPERWWWWLDVVAHLPIAALDAAPVPRRPPRGRLPTGPEGRPTPRYFSIERAFRQVGREGGGSLVRRWRVKDAPSRRRGAPGPPRSRRPRARRRAARGAGAPPGGA